MNLSLPKEISDYINDFIRPLPTLHTIVNWRNGSIKFDIDELNCSHRIGYGQDRYIRNIHFCNIHNYNMIMNLNIACDCSNIHTIYRGYIDRCIWRDNYLAIWKDTPKGNKLIWHYVDIIQCDNCGSEYMSFHIKQINNENLCNSCYEIMF